jgi:hypothetical protein
MTRDQNTIKGIAIRSTTATDCRTKNCVHEDFCCAAGKWSADVKEPEKRFSFIPELNMTWKLRDFTLGIVIFCKNFEAIVDTPIEKNAHQGELNYDGIERAPA